MLSAILSANAKRAISRGESVLSSRRVPEEPSIEMRKYEIRRKSFLSKLAIRGVLPLSTLLLGSLNIVRAQSVSPYFGFGTARDRVGTSAVCPAGQLFDGLLCEPGPTMGGLFGLFGLDFMFRRHLGVNGEYAFRFSRAPFLPGDSLVMRPAFYDLNALWQPFSGRRFVPFLEGGIGAAKVALYMTQAASATGVTNTSSFPAGSDRNRFELHFAVGLKLYVRGNLFVKPQLDLRYATHLTDQFGRNLVLQYSGSVGYTFGGR